MVGGPINPHAPPNLHDPSDLPSTLFPHLFIPPSLFLPPLFPQLIYPVYPDLSTTPSPPRPPCHAYQIQPQFFLFSFPPPPNSLPCHTAPIFLISIFPQFPGIRIPETGNPIRRKHSCAGGRGERDGWNTREGRKDPEKGSGEKGKGGDYFRVGVGKGEGDLIFFLARSGKPGYGGMGWGGIDGGGVKKRGERVTMEKGTEFVWGGNIQSTTRLHIPSHPILFYRNTQSPQVWRSGTISHSPIHSFIHSLLDLGNPRQNQLFIPYAFFFPLSLFLFLFRSPGYIFTLPTTTAKEERGMHRYKTQVFISPYLCLAAPRWRRVRHGPYILPAVSLTFLFPIQISGPRGYGVRARGLNEVG